MLKAQREGKQLAWFLLLKVKSKVVANILAWCLFKPKTVAKKVFGVFLG